MSNEVTQAMARMGKLVRPSIRAMEALRDQARLTNHRIVCELGRQWQFPEAVLTDEEIEEIEARQLGRTLAEIDDLPTADES